MPHIKNPEDEEIATKCHSPTAAPPSSPVQPPSMQPPSGPRVITAEEVLLERAALRKELGSIPHGTGRGWSSMFWVSCDCPNCRDYYDPTGVESARYMNMEFPSFFNDQSEKPSFAFSKLVNQSYLAHMGPGFYIGNAKKAASLNDVILVISPPLALKPKRILYISQKFDWDEFILSQDKTTWYRKGYEKGRSVWRDPDDPDKKIPFAELPQRLTQLYGTIN